MKTTLPHLVIEFVEYIVQPDHLLELVIHVVRALDLLVFFCYTQLVPA